MLTRILIISTIILIIAFGGVFYYQFNKSMQPSERPVITQKAAEPQAHDKAAEPQTDLDQSLVEIENMASSEGTAANEEDDASVIAEDSQAISDIGQSYDENQF